MRVDAHGRGVPGSRQAQDVVIGLEVHHYWEVFPFNHKAEMFLACLSSE